MTRLGITPSQTIGPFLHIGLIWPDGPFAVPEGTRGGCWIRGRLYDGNGEPVTDGLIETWQRNAPDGARGFARCPTGEDGEWAVLTVKPARGAGEAPHLDVSVFARGLLDRVVTRIYFRDEEEANAADPVLVAVPPARRGTLVAQPAEDGYRFDIRLQGEAETVFFDL